MRNAHQPVKVHRGQGDLVNPTIILATWTPPVGFFGISSLLLTSPNIARRLSQNGVFRVSLRSHNYTSTDVARFAYAGSSFCNINSPNYISHQVLCPAVIFALNDSLAMKKPSGHASGDTVIGVVLSFTATAAVCLGLRLWTRIGIVRSAGWDDLVCSLSLLFTIGFVICICIQVHYGLGQHEADLSPSESINLGKAFWASIPQYYLGLGLVKISICLQYMRIFGGIPKFRLVCIVVVCVLTVFMIYTVIISVFLCWPIHKFWNPKSPGRCLVKLPIWFTNSSFSVLTDIILAVLPAPVLKSLNLPRRQRRMLIVVFGLGGCICIISIVRFHSLYAIAVSTDQSWDNPLAALFAVLECTVGIVASCLPTLKGLVGKYFPHIFSTSQDISREPTPLQDLTGEHHRGKLHSSCSSEAIRDRNRGSSSRLARFGRRRVGDMDSCLEETVVGDADGPDVEKGEGIKVTTIVEQVDSRRDEDEESREHLVPVKPHERF